MTRDMVNLNRICKMSLLFLTICLMMPISAKGNDGYGTLHTDCVPYARLECAQLDSFLRQYIVPLAKRNNYDINKDRLTIDFIDLKYERTNDTVYVVEVEAYLNVKRRLLDAYALEINKGFKLYGTVIDDVRFIIRCKPDCPFVHEGGGRSICYSGYDGIMADGSIAFGINDNTARWGFCIIKSHEKEELQYVRLCDWGLSWIRDLHPREYIPGYWRMEPLSDEKHASMQRRYILEKRMALPPDTVVSPLILNRKR